MAITPASLVTLALLGARNRALTLDQIARVAAPLLDYLERRAVPAPIDELRDRDSLHATLDGLVEAGTATVFTGGTEPVWTITRRAAFYRDDAVRHFVTRGIVELSLPRAARAAGDPADAVAREALCVGDLLKLEFPFLDHDAFREELDVELRLLDPAWPMHMGSPIDALSLLVETGMLLADRCLQPFLEAQYVIADRLVARDQRAPVDREALLEECEGVGRQLVLQGRLHHAESVSRDLLASALDVAGDRGLLASDAETGRLAWLDEVDDVLARLHLIADLNATAFEDALDSVAS